jgi:hypothetical protein
MPRHHGHAVSFETPPEWDDESVVAFRAPEPLAGNPRGGPPNVMMKREVMRPGDTLYVHASRRLLELSRGLRDFDLLEIRKVLVGGQKAHYIRCTSAGDAGRIVQSFAIVEPPQSPGCVLTFAMTAAQDQAANADPIFAEILAGVTFEPSGPQTMRTPVPEADPPAVDVPMPGIRAERR